MTETVRIIRPLNALNAVVAVPGSKSFSQRALLAASLAKGRSTLLRPLEAEDTVHLIAALRRLGAAIARQGDDLVVVGMAGRPLPPSEEGFYLGNNGTATRFLLSLFALGSGDYRLTGDSRLQERPVSDLLDALSSLGVAWTCEGKRGYPPVVVHGKGLHGGRAVFSDLASSQYVSSLLLASPLAENDVEIVLAGTRVSMPYVGMTLQVMRDFGITVEERADGYRIPGRQQYRPRDYAIEGDASSASYFFLAAALTGGTVRVSNLFLPSLQGDAGFLNLLEELGCLVRADDQGTSVSGCPRVPGEKTFDLGNMPDMVPTLAVLAACRPGRTIIRNVAHLRIKESDRLAVMARELSKTGIRAEETADGLIIEGGTPQGATIKTYNDHRIAMSFAILGMVAPGMRILGPDCVRKSYPGFWDTVDGLYGGQHA